LSFVNDIGTTKLQPESVMEYHLLTKVMRLTACLWAGSTMDKDALSPQEYKVMVFMS
jgi:hypothetical protein